MQKKTLSPQWGESFGIPISTETENIIFEVCSLFSTDKLMIFNHPKGKSPMSICARALGKVWALLRVAFVRSFSHPLESLFEV